MTAKEFVRKVAQLAKEQPTPVQAVDFEPSKEGIRLTFRYKETL